MIDPEKSSSARIRELDRNRWSVRLKKGRENLSSDQPSTKHMLLPRLEAARTRDLRLELELQDGMTGGGRGNRRYGLSEENRLEAQQAETQHEPHQVVITRVRHRAGGS